MAALIDEVYSLIEEEGIAATFSVTSGTYDPATSGVESQSTATHKRKVSPPVGGDRFVSPDNVKAGSFAVSLSAKNLKFEPALGMVVDFGDGVYRITRVDPQRDASGVVAYDLVLSP